MARRGRRSVKPAGKWPFGSPTVTCSTCQGSGAYPGELQRIMDGGPMQGPRRCETCQGRGRVLVADAPACGHGLALKDCALCRGTA